MLFKKGDPSDPDNYRSISLVNCLENIFLNLYVTVLMLGLLSTTLFLSLRLSLKVAEVTSVVQIHLANPGTVVYASFIGFKGAFPSLSHRLLWKKLYERGFSSKIINILINFYSSAFACIKTPEGYTDEVKVSKGVLQGEVLSPLLFILFIADMEKFFINQGCRGLSISSSVEILISGYADDYVILADTPVELKRKLKALHEYCELNKLTVNTDKTKILVFT